MKFSGLSEWLGWLEQSHPTEIDLGLARIQKVAQRLDLITPASNIITVAGTNGKGSCVTACAALLRAANYTVGVYTSPHLLHYAERIQVNGKPVADADICAAFEKIYHAAAEISLTYFEYGTLAAFIIFKQYAVDYMVLEVGLGGRLDAVNILDADVAVITSIAIDHQDWLGDDRESIGREKAGIIRSGKFMVCADENPPLSILSIVNELKPQAYFINRDFSYRLNGSEWQWENEKNTYSFLQTPHLPLPSMAAALQVIHLLNINLSPALIEKTLCELQLAGRFQKIEYRGRQFILDVAHNPAATAYFASRLQAEKCSGKTYALVAMMADKDRLASLSNLTSIIDAWYLLQLELPRAATSAMLSENLSNLDVEPACAGNIQQLISNMIESTTEDDRLLVFGSFFTVAEALAYMQSSQND